MVGICMYCRPHNLLILWQIPTKVNKGATINHLGGRGAKQKKKRLEGHRKKKKIFRPRGLKKIMFGQFNPEKNFVCIFPVKLMLLKKLLRLTLAKKMKIWFGGSPGKKFVREIPHQAPPRWLMVDP